ncbi:MAG TPA: TIGR00282 family metallophosphoesterase [Hyphomicrobiales bacterium]|nr:TIGR00282 family metallophosphoesterase [Hyphomicrobiales bacterium]
MRLLFLGDVVGRSGRQALARTLPDLRRSLDADFVVVNGENAAGGFGITEDIFNEFIDLGADVVTLGNHAWDQREALVFIEREPRLLRPVNYPAGTPGRGANVYAARSGAQVLVVNAMGRIFMEALDDPFAALARELEACGLGAGADVIVVDFHAEATSEKLAAAHFVDGRASVLFGTHTHIPTSDHQILTGGTAYMTDIGMCGDYDSVIGMDKEEPLNRFLTRLPGSRFEAATGEATFSGLAVEIDDRTGLATAAGPVRIGGRLEPTLPAFWSQ